MTGPTPLWNFIDPVASYTTTRCNSATFIGSLGNLLQSVITNVEEDSKLPEGWVWWESDAEHTGEESVSPYAMDDTKQDYTTVDTTLDEMPVCIDEESNTFKVS